MAHNRNKKQENPKRHYGTITERTRGAPLRRLKFVGGIHFRR